MDLISITIRVSRKCKWQRSKSTKFHMCKNPSLNISRYSQVTWKELHSCGCKNTWEIIWFYLCCSQRSFCSKFAGLAKETCSDRMKIIYVEFNSVTPWVSVNFSFSFSSKNTMLPLKGLNSNYCHMKYISYCFPQHLFSFPFQQMIIS